MVGNRAGFLLVDFSEPILPAAAEGRDHLPLPPPPPRELAQLPCQTDKRVLFKLNRFYLLKEQSDGRKSKKK